MVKQALSETAAGNAKSFFFSSSLRFFALLPFIGFILGQLFFNQDSFLRGFVLFQVLVAITVFACSLYRTLFYLWASLLFALMFLLGRAYSLKSAPVPLFEDRCLQVLIGASDFSRDERRDPTLQSRGVPLLEDCAIMSWERRGELDFRAKLHIRGRVLEIYSRSASDAVKLLVETAHPIAGRKLIVQFAELPWSNAFQVGVGCQIEFDGVFSSNNLYLGQRLPVFSYQSYLFRRGIVGSGKGTGLILASKEPKAWKERMIFSLIEDFGQSDGLSLLLAGVLGSEDLLGRHVRDIFSATGTTHLLVVSGFQVSALFGVLFWLFSKSISWITWVRFYNLVTGFSAFLSLIVLTGYVALVGWEPSLVRALIALMLYLFDRSFHRRIPTELSLSAVLCIMSLLWPGCVAEPGVQFCFAAIIGLIVANKICLSLSAAEEKGWRWKLVHNVSCCVGAWICTAPFVYLWFGTFNVLSPFINAVVAVPFTIATVIFGSSSLLLWYFGVWGSGYLLRLTLFVIELIFFLVEWMSLW